VKIAEFAKRALLQTKLQHRLKLASPFGKGWSAIDFQSPINLLVEKSSFRRFKVIQNARRGGPEGAKENRFNPRRKFGDDQDHGTSPSRLLDSAGSSFFLQPFYCKI
jgi:hypothetical protein